MYLSISVDEVKDHHIYILLIYIYIYIYVHKYFTLLHLLLFFPFLWERRVLVFAYISCLSYYPCSIDICFVSFRMTPSYFGPTNIWVRFWSQILRMKLRCVSILLISDEFFNDKHYGNILKHKIIIRILPQF